MKVVFADSFWKSLKRLERRQTWWYKIYETFRYNIPMFIENVWFFRKELWNFRSWDSGYNLDLFARSLEKTVYTIEHYGNEIDKIRLKRVAKIKRAIEILKSRSEHDYIERAEKELGELHEINWGEEGTPEQEEHNRKVFKRTHEIEAQDWDEFWTILKGQDYKEFEKVYEKLTEEEKRKYDHYAEWFDGSGIKGWWD